MTEDSYWVELSYQSRTLGAGFFLTTRHVVTADHCLNSVPADTAVLDLILTSGATIRACVCQRLPEPDLALLMVIGEEQPVEPPLPDVCAVDDRWRSPSRPTPSDPELGGLVMAPDVQYKCEAGGQVAGLQLRTDMHLGDYSGYSGGPVEKMVGNDRALAGVLIEQYPDRQAPERAANVLFAAAIAELFERFSSFSLVPIMTQRLVDPKSSSLDTTLSKATRILEEAKRWEQNELMPPNEIMALRLRVARSVVDEPSMWTAHD